MYQKTNLQIKNPKQSFKSNFFSLSILAFTFLSHGVAHADYQFLDAHAAAKKGNQEQLSNYQFSMSEGLFAMYPEYWMLNSELAYQTPESVENFTRTYWQTVMGEKLVADYVEKMAGLGNYQKVVDLSRYVTNADPSEACAIAIGKNGTGDAVGALSLKHKVWLTVGKQPELCHQLADELINNQLISDDDKMQRMRVLLREDKRSKAVDLAQQISLYDLNDEVLSQISQNPQAYLTNAYFDTNVDKLKYLYAIARAAYNSVDDAAMYVEQYSAELDSETLQYAYRILAMNTMNNVVSNGFHPQTVTWFDNSYGTTFSRKEVEAYGRVAVRSGQWQSVFRAISAMDEELKQERVWQYWFARAGEHSDDRETVKLSKSFYQSLAQKNDYYGLLAQDRIGQPLVDLPTPYEPSQEDQNRMFSDPHFSRAFSLRDMSAPHSYTKREWNWAVRQAKINKDDGMILAAAKQATDIGWYDRAIYAADSTIQKSNYFLAYLTPFQDQVVYHSNQVGIEPSWAYGIMRQESRFQKAAKSHVGAGGLMQIMPSTGKYIARKLGESYSKRKLTQMDTNIRWGTFYLSHISKELQYSPVLATAGYNAGPSRARRWQSNYTSIPADQYIEAIPFEETRTYVKNVMTNAVHYSFVLNSGNPSISQLMGDIPSRQ